MSLEAAVGEMDLAEEHNPGDCLASFSPAAGDLCAQVHQPVKGKKPAASLRDAPSNIFLYLFTSDSQKLYHIYVYIIHVVSNYVIINCVLSNNYNGI